MYARLSHCSLILVALLACKAGNKSSVEPELGAAAASDTQPASAPASPPKAGRVALPVVEGKSRTQHGFVVIPGEVKNTSSSWLRSVRVEIELLDASGKPIQVDSILGAEGWAEGVVGTRNVVPPGEVSVFRYTRDMKKLARPYASHRLSAEGVIGDDTMSASVSDIQQEKDKLDFYKLRGKVTSTGSAGCRSPQAVIGLYASDGKLWDVKSADPDEWFLKVMPKGTTADFEYRAIDGQNGVFSRIEVWGDCRR